MKKRLRKKFRLGEFREMGFDLTFALRDGVPLNQNGINVSFCDQFLDFAEARRCGFGGACGQKWNGFVMYLWEGSVTEVHRQEIREYLIYHPDVQADTVACGPLRDAIHGWEPRGKLDYRHRRYLGHIDWKLAAIADIYEQTMQGSKKTE